ncbi:hypothetical protein POP72_055 [Pectobacterium phage POP72]|uniref:Uncharacterized protein n=2 Tax=Axomammavirus PP1 TaxID=2733578 RepID=I7F504_9CAUD|nr:hypothetical protein F486_gp48 [Pectobacterium phage PP1]AFP33711.1 hypothetical protein PP1_048 [Pectobacterium phage PP1]ARB10971.1 hypothetical protein POP72_055 [Pectobacterium phage POP72]
MSNIQMMKKEEKDLRTKVGRLGVFTSDSNSSFMSLPVAEREDMLLQLHSMENYLFYLGNRIKRAELSVA